MSLPRDIRVRIDQSNLITSFLNTIKDLSQESDAKPFFFVIDDPSPEVYQWTHGINQMLINSGFTRITNKDRYFEFPSNEHHWTTNDCWCRVIPLLCHLLDLQFIPTDFRLISNEICVNGSVFNFGYHELKDLDDRFSILNLDSNVCLTGNHKIFRGKTEWTAYHDLYVFSHRNSLISNTAIKTNMRIAMLTDSMAIPIIPILSCLCDKLLIIDNRLMRHSMIKTIRDFHPTHIITFGTTRSFPDGILKHNIMN